MQTNDLPSTTIDKPFDAIKLLALPPGPHPNRPPTSPATVKFVKIVLSA
jgi:hypothetical protein